MAASDWRSLCSTVAAGDQAGKALRSTSVDRRQKERNPTNTESYGWLSHGHFTLLLAFYDPHHADQIVFTQEFLETEKLKANNNPQVMDCLSCPISISHSLWVERGV